MNRTHSAAGVSDGAGLDDRLYGTDPPIDARAEAAQWLHAALNGRPLPPLVIVIGLADGDLLDVLDEHRSTKVLAIEPDPTCADNCRRRRDWSAWQSSGRLTYLAGPAYDGADAAWRAFPPSPDAHVLLVHPRLRVDTPAAVQAARVAKQLIFGARANAEARRRFAPRYLTNVIRNVPAIARGADVASLRDRFAGVPAVIAGAGPSLDAHLPSLRDAHERALFIAVDTALRPLTYAGAAPQLVVAADPSAENARHFQWLAERPDTWLVAESALAPSAAATFADRTFWFRLATHHPWPWLKAHGLDLGLVEMWGSVLTAAFEIACLAGCDPIVFIGSDLAYTSGRPYCRGTSYEFDWAFDVATGASLDAVWQHRCALGESQTLPDLRGTPTLSKSHLVSFRDWLVTRAARSGRRVINASGEGILHGAGIEQASLDAAIGGRRAIPPVRAIATNREPQPGLAAALNEIRDAVARARSISPVREWEEFCSGGFDTAQVSDTLAAAASGGDGLTNTSAAFPPMPPLDLDAHAATRRTLAALPEAAARFAQALAGAAMPRGPVADRAALLADAFALLTDVQAAVRREPDLAGPVDERRFGVVPVGPPCWWSEPIRWSVHAFEALVGDAWVATPEGPTPVPFWSPQESQVREAIPPSDHPHSDRAVVLLAGEWMMAAAGQVAGSDPAAQLLSWWRWIAPRLAAVDATAPAPTCGATVAIVVRGDGHDHALRWPLVIGASEWLRLRTGALTRGAEPVQLARIEIDGLAVSLEIEAAGAGAPAVIDRSSPASLVQPHVLTDRGLSRSIVAYATAQGVVCVTAHAQHSVIVARDGTSRTHHEWPRSIVFELPYGDGGAIAWSNGCGRWPSIEPAYVMHRRCAGGDVTVEELPFRPALGTWWRDRVWFACYPAAVGAWTGVASWRPGSVPAFDYPGVMALALRSEGEALVIEPGVPAEKGGFKPQRPATQWRSDRRRRLARAESNPNGACSSRATAGGWTASAFPHADLVRVMSHDGRAIDLVCEAPFGLGWAGSALIVSTAKRDVLLFPDLITRLDDVARSGGL